MRTIYLIRHAQPVEREARCCISQTDFPLSNVGMEQAKCLETWFQTRPVEQIYTSPLHRCRMTAGMVFPNRSYEICDSLKEVLVGEWEGLSFREIKEKWPVEYEERGKQIGTYAPPGGESFAHAAERMDGVIRGILSDSKGDIAVFTHSGILRAWLCKIRQISMDRLFEKPISMGSVTEVHWNGNGFRVIASSVKPNLYPGRMELEELFRKCETPKEVREHGYAVADMAMRLMEQKRKTENNELLYHACVLHDLCRTVGKNHPQKAGQILRKAGYEAVAEIIEQHHDLYENPSQEAELLYLADKLVRGTKRISLEERFSGSREKCKTKEAEAAWKKRYRKAIELYQKYEG